MKKSHLLSLLYLPPRRSSVQLYSSLTKLPISLLILPRYLSHFFLLSPPSNSTRYISLGEKVSKFARPKTPTGMTILATSVAGFGGTHVFVALKRHSDGILSLKNFNHYYNVNLKRARQKVLERSAALQWKETSTTSRCWTKFLKHEDMALVPYHKWKEN